jgi:SAM-dependent methyltransferase
MSAIRSLSRRIKSMALQTDTAYRLYLRLLYGAGRPPALPEAPLPNSTLQTRAEWQQALEFGRKLHLPLHRGIEKNWDHLAAVYAIVSRTGPDARILDAGAEFYGNILPALFVYGYRHLYGINLAFTRPARRGPIRYLPGDITRTAFADNDFDAITCMSVIEHGVPLEAYFREMHRILKPGGLLFTSTDYFPTPVDTRGQMAHDAPIKIFTKPEIESALDIAQRCGFELTGPVGLECKERPIRWAQYQLDYSFLLFTLRKKPVQ